MNKPHKPAVFEDKIIAISPKSFTKKIRDSLIAKVVDNGGCPVENVNPKVKCGTSHTSSSPPLTVAPKHEKRSMSWSVQLRRRPRLKCWRLPLDSRYEP